MQDSRFALAMALLAVVACSSKRDASNDEERPAAATSSADAPVIAASSDKPTRSAQPSFREGANGEVWMNTTNGAMLMGIRNDSVLIGFSDSLRKAVKAGVDTSLTKDTKGEESSTIGRVVKSAVQAGVRTTLHEVFDKERGFPISDLKDARLESGHIVFDYRHKPTFGPDNVKDDGKSMLEQFHPADAARFVGAVRARLKG